ncbi:MAG: sulfite exporter TauE/SafE family protein [Kiritimatiellia bacterium]|jgi:hypothetical protein|nr:sulfite exporter TauE/SafE family protein [Kiritimatiellia bacterium]MDP6631071.1 sulfite exporter TauE/SafE family protein [Kiritimatiellia bacterium]MDP6810027.1 sulfite exporter TauE/SafE family protein [Kiritimatiellia bacterium]MDP7024798.1 sulfite exporter TauE/SafE family protein [Kiritimatiellia bacterium]
MSFFTDVSPTLLLLGLAAGILSSMLGVGSGILLVPSMVLIFGLAQKSAQGTALAVMVPMAMVGAIRYISNPDIEISFAQVALLVPGAMIGALIGSAIAAHVPNEVLRRLFAIFLLVVAVRMLLPKRGTRKAPASQPAEQLANGEQQ